MVQWLRSVGFSGGQMYLRKWDDKHIKNIESIALWKTITSNQMYFFDDTMIKCGEKVNV